MSQKRILAINDISGVGKCSLTISLPIISVAGIETNVLPTAILSTHTGGFEGFTFRDLTDDLLPIVEHWQTLDLAFSGIYSGYLGSIEQIELISQIFDKLKTEDTLIFVDPVMGDAGVLYSKFDTSFPEKMRFLCAKADIIVPNITEACYLLNKPYLEGPYNENDIMAILKKLAMLGPDIVCLTGVYFAETEMGAAIYDKRTNEVSYVMSEKIEGFYHGTGDVFASSLFAGIVKGMPLNQALRIAVDFTVTCIKRTQAAGTDTRLGVEFESELWRLGEHFSKFKNKD